MSWTLYSHYVKNIVVMLAHSFLFSFFWGQQVDKICWLPLPQFGSGLDDPVNIYCWLPRTCLTCSKPLHVFKNCMYDLLHKIPVPQFMFLSTFRNLLPISHVCTEDGEKPMVLLPFMAWGNLKLFLRQCKLAEANNPQVRLQLKYSFAGALSHSLNH